MRRKYGVSLGYGVLDVGEKQVTNVPYLGFAGLISGPGFWGRGCFLKGYFSPLFSVFCFYSWFVTTKHSLTRMSQLAEDYQIASRR